MREVVVVGVVVIDGGDGVGGGKGWIFSPVLFSHLRVCI